MECEPPHDDSVVKSYDSPEKRALQAYNTAVRLLGSRDHSVAELTRKLRQREHDEDAISDSLEELTELNYVNDQRYAQLFTEQRVEKGSGPLLIQSKLRERGIDQRLVAAALATFDGCWCDYAQAVLEKRFDAQGICSREKRDEARIARFLASRGFAMSDALRALKAARAEIERGSRQR